MPPLDEAPWQSQSPTLLAEESPTVPEAQTPEARETKAQANNWNTIRQHLDSSIVRMRTKRFGHWTYAGQIAEFEVPDRWHYFVTPNKTYRGGIRSQSILDDTAGLAGQICESGLWSYMTNPSHKWLNVLGVRGLHGEQCKQNCGALRVAHPTQFLVTRLLLYQ